MKKNLILIASLCLVSCDPPAPSRVIRFEIPPEYTPEAAKFVIDLCAASNPKSDEEPEDMIEAAWNTAIKLYGDPIKYINRHDGNGWVRE